MEITENRFRNDEPTDHDSLGRDGLAEALATLTVAGETPMTVGIFAGWGAGKTSLVRLIQKSLPSASTHVVHFNAWEHQAVKHPVVALAHAIRNSLTPSEKEDQKFRDLLIKVAISVGDQAVSRWTGISVLDLFGKAAAAREEEARRAEFQQRDISMRLRDHLHDLIRTTQEAHPTSEGSARRRIVIFIDDLDRCDGDRALELLQALKLYFNLPDCVFFLSVDRGALQQSIAARYPDLPMDQVHYLDKIIQLPVNLPQIEPERFEDFVANLLPGNLQAHAPWVARGLPNNPRQAKRFVNAFVLNAQLAKALHSIDDESEKTLRALCLLLLIQHRRPALHEALGREPGLLGQIFAEDETEADESLRERHFGDDLELEELVRESKLAEHGDLERLIYMTDTTGLSEAEETTAPTLKMEGSPVTKQAAEPSFLSEAELEEVIQNSKYGDSQTKISGTLLLFRTRTQRTWLIRSGATLFCLLDDAQTRRNQRLIQWAQPIGSGFHVRAHLSRQGNHVIDLGNRRNWLYSRRLHPEARLLEEKVRNLIA